jgi:hypothetical protein
VRRKRVGLDTDVGQVLSDFTSGAQLSLKCAVVSLRNLRVGLAGLVEGRRCRHAARWLASRSRRAARSRRRRTIVVR